MNRVFGPEQISICSGFLLVVGNVRHFRRMAFFGTAEAFGLRAGRQISDENCAEYPNFA